MKHNPDSRSRTRRHRPWQTRHSWETDPPANDGHSAVRPSNTHTHTPLCRHHPPSQPHPTPPPPFLRFMPHFFFLLRISRIARAHRLPTHPHHHLSIRPGAQIPSPPTRIAAAPPPHLILVIIIILTVRHRQPPRRLLHMHSPHRDRDRVRCERRTARTSSPFLRAYVRQPRSLLRQRK